MANESSAARRYSRDFSILFLVMLITGGGNTALQSILANIGRSLHVSDLLIAIVFSASALIWVFAAPVWARRSDLPGGRKKMVLLGSGGFTISIGLVGLFLFAGLNGWFGPVTCLITVLSARIIYGMFGSAAPPAAQAMIALRTTREERTKALTLLGSAFGLGTIIGPAFAPLLVLPGVGLAGPALCFALLGACAWLAAYLFLEDEVLKGASDEARGANISYPSLGGAPAGASITAATAERVEDKLTFRDSRIWPWMLCGLVMGHAQAMTGQAMGFLVIDRLNLPIGAASTQQAMALVFIAGAAAALLVQWGLIPNVKMKPRTMMIVGLSISTIGLVGTANAGSLYTIAFTYALSSIGFGFSRPAYTAGSSLAVTRRLQGPVAGLVTSVNGSSFVLGPLLGVGMYQLWHALPFLVSAALLIALIPYGMRALKTDDQAPAS